MAGLAALVYLARLNSAEADLGEPLMLPAIAAVLIGGTSLFGGVGGLGGTLVGALLLTLVLNGMNLLNIHSNWQPLVTGLIVLIAAAIDSARGGFDSGGPRSGRKDARRRPGAYNSRTSGDVR